MTATVSAGRLKEAAAWTCRSIAARPSVPVMGAAVIQIQDGSLTVSGWDWEMLTRYTAGASGELERTLVNARLLLDIAGRMRDEVTLEREGTHLLIRSGRNRSALHTMPVGDYPTEPKGVGEVGVLDGFGELVARVAPSAAGPDAQPAWMQGVVLSAAADELSAMATDRYVISHSVAAWTGGEFTVNIPARRLADIARHIDGKVSLGIGNGLSIDSDERHASILATEESNANIQQYLRLDGWTYGAVRVDRAGLSDAIDLVTPTVGKDMPVRLYVASDGITVRSSDQGIGESEAFVESDLTGIDEFAIAMSPGYLMKALDATPSDVVCVNFGSSARKPVLVHGVADGDPDLKTRHVVMPIRVDDFR